MGALCGACLKQYDYDVGRSRCAPCVGVEKMLLRAGVLTTIFLVIAALLVLFFQTIFGVKYSYWWHAIVTMLKDRDEGLDDEIIDSIDVEDVMEVENEVLEEEVEDEEKNDTDVVARRRGLTRSVVTKLKIVIAAWQIGSSTDWIFWQVRFPPIYTKVTRLFGFLGFTFFDVGSFKCLFNWSYFDKLLVVTVAPFGILAGGASIYWMIQGCLGHLRDEDGRRHTWNNILYGTLLFIYIALPSIATTVVTRAEIKFKFRYSAT